MSLSRQHQWLFVQAWFLLAYLRFSLMVRPLKKRLQNLQLHRCEVESPMPAEEQRALAGLIGWAVTTAAHFTPWESACLVQVLAAQHMLQNRGIPGVFYLGATTEAIGLGASDLAAHAWLKCGKDFITGESGHSQYTVISSFSWS